MEKREYQYFSVIYWGFSVLACFMSIRHVFSVDYMDSFIFSCH